MGADENSSSPANDVGVTSIVTPTAPLTAGSQQLKATVKNYGTNSVSSLTVYYTNNGGSVTSETFNFSPVLAQCDVATVTFSSNITLATGSNNVKIYTALSGDAAIAFNFGSIGGNDTE